MMFVSIGIGTVIAVALIVVVSFLTSGNGTASNGQPANALVGTSVKEFTLAGLNGGTVASPWTSGHAGVLIFFASWCEPCKTEMPKVAAYLRRHRQGSIEIVGIDVNDLPGPAQRFVTSSGVSFAVAVDPAFTLTSGAFHFIGIPETVFVNDEGVVTEVYSGAIPKEQLMKGLAALKAA